MSISIITTGYTIAQISQLVSLVNYMLSSAVSVYGVIVRRKHSPITNFADNISFCYTDVSDNVFHLRAAAGLIT